jgi:hypothetical protein
MVPIGVALNKTQPYVETNYSLPTFQQYISGQITAVGNASTTTPGASQSPSPSSATSNKKSSAVTIRVSSSGTWWTLLSAGMLLSGLLL